MNDNLPRVFYLVTVTFSSLPGQVLQAVRAAHVLLHPHVCAVLRVGGVSVGSLLRPGCAEVHAGAERHLAGQQRRSHVGKQAL